MVTTERGEGEAEEGSNVSPREAEFPRRNSSGKDKELSVNYVSVRCLQDIHANGSENRDAYGI